MRDKRCFHSVATRADSSRVIDAPTGIADPAPGYAGLATYEGRKPSLYEFQMIKEYGPRPPDRAIEWVSSFCMVGWALILSMPGDSFAGIGVPVRTGVFQWLNENFVSWIFGIVGTARLIALYVNGRWPKTPMTRMVGAVIGVALWSQVSLMFMYVSEVRGTWTPSVVVYAALAVADLFSVYRASRDARYLRR